MLFEVVQFDRLLDRLKELDEKYNIVCGAIDRHPQIILSNMVRDWSEKRIYPVVYGQNRDVEPHTELDGNIDYYTINRTNDLDTVKDLINTHKMKFYGYGNLKSTIIEHYAICSVMTVKMVLNLVGKNLQVTTTSSTRWDIRLLQEKCGTL